MKLKALLLIIVLNVFTLGCESRKTLRMTEKEINSLDSLGYKIYPYKKDKEGNYYLDTLNLHNLDKFDSLDMRRKSIELNK
ncbi:MAG: hypothetical protein MUF58_20175 [Arcicella sp.]|jgi:predicted GNAT superfamily acetyltransferase|nr:hypothetical protein [Arcicella sp.]